MATGPITYNDYLEGINQPHVRDIVNSFIEHELIITHFPIFTDASLIQREKRLIGGLPLPTFAPIGAPLPAPFKVNFEDYEETAFMARDIFQADSAWKRDKNWIKSGKDPFTPQINAYMEGLAFQVNNCFINNAPTVGPIQDPYMFTGIKYRVLGSQSQFANVFPQFGNSPSVVIQSSADLSDAGLSASSNIAMQKDFDKLFDRMGVKNGKGITLLANPQLWRQFNADVKTSATAGGFRIDQDALGRKVMKYQEAEILNVGYQAPSVTGVQQTPVISSEQDYQGLDPSDPGYNPIGNVGDQGTTVYAVRSGEDYFATWQFCEPIIEKWFPVPGTFTDQINFQHFFGLWCPNTRALGAITGVKTNGPSDD